MEIAPNVSGYHLNCQLARFINLPDLMRIVCDVSDSRTKVMMNSPVPRDWRRIDETPFELRHPVGAIVIGLSFAAKAAAQVIGAAWPEKQSSAHCARSACQAWRPHPPEELPSSEAPA